MRRDGVEGSVARSREQSCSISTAVVQRLVFAFRTRKVLRPGAGLVRGSGWEVRAGREVGLTWQWPSREWRCPRALIPCARVGPEFRRSQHKPRAVGSVRCSPATPFSLLFNYSTRIQHHLNNHTSQQLQHVP